MDDMDVDSGVCATSGLKRVASASSTTGKRPKLVLPSYELAILNTNMNECSEEDCWRHRSTVGKPQEHSLFSEIFSCLTMELATTSMKDIVFTGFTKKEASAFLASLDDNDLSEWRYGVMNGIGTGNWEALVTHPKLRKPAQRQNVESEDDQAIRLHDKFHRAFHGGVVEKFVDGLRKYDEIYDPKVYFGRTIPIVQSSGTGKSRMVQELGKKEPTLSVCFRESSRPRIGWPPNDEPARSFFLKEHNPAYKGEELAAAFLGAIMQIVADKLKVGSRAENTPQNWMKDWELDTPTDVANSSRHESFNQVEQLADRLLEANRSDIERMRIGSPSLDDDDSDIKRAVAWHNALFRLLCLKSFQELAKELISRKSELFILAFDECSQLNLRNPTPGPGKPPSRGPLWNMSLIALLRIIKAYDSIIELRFRFWFLILDTTSSVIEMVPYGPKANSLRLTRDLRPLPPWTYLGFNQMAQKDVMARIKLPTDVLTMEHLKIYGRPYWSTLENWELPQAAYEKLFSNVFNPSDENHVFAAFAIRAGLEIGEGKASDRLAIEAVRSHMRILRRVVDQLIVTDSPSEPMLAIAAANGLTEWEGSYEKALETLLDKLILRGLVLDRGLLGEFVSRLLLLMTRDKTTTSGGREFLDMDGQGSYKVRAVQLSEFLKTLLGDDLGIPTNPLLDRLLQDASEVWINFTHFVPLRENIDEVTPRMLFEAWSSGFAFQCAFNQPVIDGLIVAYYGKLDKPFEMSNLFVIPWQTKARSDAAELALANALTAPFLVKEDNTRHKPWHLAIFMDLATSSSFGKARGPRCDLSWGGAVRPKGAKTGGTWRGYAQANETEGTRYCLNIRGHSAETYPVIGKTQKQFGQLFKRVLGSMEPLFVADGEYMDDAMDRVWYD